MRFREMRQGKDRGEEDGLSMRKDTFAEISCERREGVLRDSLFGPSYILGSDDVTLLALV